MANTAMTVGVAIAASQADQETGTSTTTVVTPGRQHFHVSAAKAWLKAGITGNNLASYNIASLTDTGTGVLTVAYTTAFSGNDYSLVLGNVYTDGGAGTLFASAATSTGCVLQHENSANGSALDPTNYFLAAFGDQ